MISVDHAALWARDIEKLKKFYQTYFGAQAGPKYINEKKRFQSYFLTFSSGARLEIMQRPDVERLEKASPDQEFTGYAHLAFAVGSEKGVDELTARLAAGGHILVDGPRRTGDGYYESVILDPEGNRIEITA